MTIEVNYGLSWNPHLVEPGGYGRFHQMKRLDTAKSLSNLAGKYSADGDLASAERVLLDIDFAHAVGRTHYTKQTSTAEITNNNAVNRDIEHIHHNCVMKILRDMEPMLEDELIEMFLRDMREKYPSKAKEIDLILCAINGENPLEKVDDFWNFTHDFYLSF